MTYDPRCPACGQPLEERHQGAWCRYHGKVLTCCEGPIDRSCELDQEKAADLEVRSAAS